MSRTLFLLPTLTRLMSKTKMPFSTRPLMNLCQAGRGEASCKKSVGLGSRAAFLGGHGSLWELSVPFC